MYVELKNTRTNNIHRTTINKKPLLKKEQHEHSNKVTKNIYSDKI